jgi:hypothetical protein
MINKWADSLKASVKRSMKAIEESGYKIVVADDIRPLPFLVWKQQAQTETTPPWVLVAAFHTPAAAEQWVLHKDTEGLRIRRNHEV